MMNSTLTPAPKYLAIERDLRLKIRSGALRPGARLPVELDLCRQYGVSRVTLRRALGILAGEGRLLSITGRGTFVTRPSDPRVNDVRRRRGELRRAGKTLAALIPSIAVAHYPEIIRGVEEECAKRGYQLVLGNFDDDLGKESDYLQRFMETGVRGVLVAPHYRSNRNPQYRVLRERGIPLTVIDCPIRGVEADLVATDNEAGACEGTHRLIEAGARMIAFVGGWTEAITAQERLAGFRKAMREAGLRVPRELVCEGPFTAQFGYEVCRDLCAGRELDAVFSANDPITTGLLRAMAEGRVRVAANPMVASFDVPEIPYMFRCRLLIVEQPRREMGIEACRLLLARVEEHEPAGPVDGAARSPRDAFRRVLLAPRVYWLGTKESRGNEDS